MKYSLLRYYYTQFFSISSPHSTTSAFFKPLFYEYPNDVNAWEDIERHIMLGSAIMFSPNIRPDTTTSEDFYFPAGTWADINGGSVIVSTGKKQTLYTGTDKINLHMREGHIIPFQNAIERNRLKVHELKDIFTNIIMSLDSTGAAKGRIYFDDGETVGGPNVLVDRTASLTGKMLTIKNKVVSARDVRILEDEFLYISEIKILNAKNKALTNPGTVTDQFGNQIMTETFAYDSTKEWIMIRLGIQIPYAEDFELRVNFT